MRGIASVVGATLALVLMTSQGGWAQLGPDEGGATLKTPFDIGVPTKPAPKKPGSYVENVIHQATPKSQEEGGGPIEDGSSQQVLRSLPPWQDPPDINKDIHVTPAQGPWLILIQSYTAPDAATMAREMVTELRGQYKLAAYTFNYGTEERKKEYERIRTTIETQREYLRKNNLPLDQPIRVRTIRIQEQVGVLVGGYATDEAARRALTGIRKLPPPDPKRVKLDRASFVSYGKNDKEKSKGDAGPGNRVEKLQEKYFNPFESAFIVRNPSIKHEQPKEDAKHDLALLRKLNAHEPFSLLNCKKSVTLAIKQFNTPTAVENTGQAPSVLQTLGLVKNKARDDAAATMAHGLAENFRDKLKLDAYVLHTKFASIVTVGSFDGLEDPAMRSMQQLLETRLQIPQLGLLPRAMPMQVPR